MLQGSPLFSPMRQAVSQHGDVLQQSCPPKRAQNCDICCPPV
ncbi:hypothetical protein FKM82_001382 [Ascaphus truei]